MPEKKRIRNVFNSKAPSAYQAIESLCLKYLPAEDRKILELDQKRFHKAFQSLNEQIQGFQKDIGDITLASFITEWARAFKTDAIHGERYIRDMSELIESGILQLITDKKSPYTASTFGSRDHLKVIETIRCYVDWSDLFGNIGSKVTRPFQMIGGAIRHLINYFSHSVSHI